MLPSNSIGHMVGKNRPSADIHCPDLVALNLKVGAAHGHLLRDLHGRASICGLHTAIEAQRRKLTIPGVRPHEAGRL